MNQRLKRCLSSFMKAEISPMGEESVRRRCGLMAPEVWISDLAREGMVACLP